MSKPKSRKPLFSLAQVLFRNSSIEGRGVFARKRFARGDVITPYAPQQQRLSIDDPAATAAAASKFTLVSEEAWVIVPDTSVPGGWLCNHSCSPNAAIYSDAAGRIQCLRPIDPGQEVTIFYGWVTVNEPERDPCRCGAKNCRKFINFDLSDDDARHCEAATPEGVAFRDRFQAYADYLVSIEQEQVLDRIAARLGSLRRQLR
ncbi:MAG TPA: SET domain-containing protein-lysine N-methyltransferase [Polyangiaceae bacterium]|nr:SET domain-containing protein-lysine N-methyltransferase [Polyangiaceae bacterium]